MLSIQEKDFTGQRFGRLITIKKIGKHISCGGNTTNIWLCQCDCGNMKKATVSDLTSGYIKSCGCLQTESRFTHHLTNTKLYRVYYSMKMRCYNSNDKAYSNYGGRGIKICEEWLADFLNFYNWSIENGYVEGLTIDRIDVNGDYSPENCRWITHREQQLNKRNNKRFFYDEKNLTLAEWSKIYNIKLDTLVSRIYNRNWSIERALNEPVHTDCRNKNAK